MKKHAATLITVVLAAALGLWLWLDRDHVTSGERKMRENNVFPVWRKEELAQITIVHEGETIVLVRDGASWRMDAPRKERADPAAVDRLLTTLEFATVARRASESTSLGLESPRASGALRMGGLVLNVALGGPSPRPENSSYFRVGDGPPIVVGKELADALLASSDVYRDRAVVPYLATELARFQVTHPGGGFALARIDDRSFKLEGAGVLASRGAVERMWNALAEMRAEAFPKDADVDRLTAHPVLTLTMTPKDGKQPAAEIAIGEACPGHPADVVVLRKVPTRIAACAPKDIVNALLAAGPALLERHPFTLRMDEVEELRLERLSAPVDAGSGAPPAIEIARKGTTFHERAPADRDLSPEEAEAATEILTRLAAAEAESVTAGAGPFAAVARARMRSGEHEEVVEIGPPDARGHAVLRRVLDDARLDAGPVLVRLLLPRETTLRPHTIVAAETRRATRVILRCGVEQELVDRGEGFRLVTPRGFEADAAIAQLVDAILRGRVDPWIADADDGTFGFTRDGCHVVLAFEDGNAPLTVWFGAEGEGGVYGRVDTRAGVFVAPKALRELAGRLYVSRGSLRTEASRIERVRVTFEGRPVVREASALRDAVAALYADRVVALGKKIPPPDLVIDVALSEGGPPRRIACAPEVAAERLCTVDGVDATFGLASSRLAPVLPGGGIDGGPSSGSRDGGPR
ncbi:MAG TPA: hypothetical protein VLT33_31180 [Labilithrix sp.]|nr:hypothetical protein [Labilithrix sp.]